MADKNSQPVMQDWFTDSHETFEQTFKTMTELYAEEFRTCTTCEQRPWFSFFFDGTRNNKGRDAAVKKWSNVARLFDGHILDEPLIVKRYYEGVGTPFDASNPRWIDSVRDSEVLGGGAGAGGDARLRRAETDLNDALRNNHRVTRIDVAVFGFSRGATLARAFVNRILDKCEYRDGQPYWPCRTALDGKAAPIHFRFLGIFDTVESVGVPARNLTGMKMAIPDAVEKCLHLVAGHEIRTAFALTRLGMADSQHREIVYPGVHADVGGGYRPGEQGRSDTLARLPLNRMRLEAAMAGVPFTPPANLDPDVANKFGYDRVVKDGFDEYMRACGYRRNAGGADCRTHAALLWLAQRALQRGPVQGLRGYLRGASGRPDRRGTDRTTAVDVVHRSPGQRSELAQLHAHAGEKRPERIPGVDQGDRHAVAAVARRGGLLPSVA